MEVTLRWLACFALSIIGEEDPFSKRMHDVSLFGEVGEIVNGREERAGQLPSGG